MADELEPRQYPLPAPVTGDERFAFGLMLDVAEVLEKHGYPKLAVPDMVALQAALFRFLYSAPGGESRG